MAEKSIDSLQQEMEEICKILGTNSFHEFADLNYKTEKNYNENCKKALFDYYDRNHNDLGKECVSKIVEYIQEYGKDFGLDEWGYNTSLNQIKEWLMQIEVNYTSLKQEYDNSLQQKPQESIIEPPPQSDATKTSTPEAKKVLLKLPAGLNREERKELEDAFYKAGARYTKETIPAEKSNTGKEVHYKSWYVMQKENTDMTPFVAYIRPEKTPSRQEPTNSGQQNIRNNAAQVMSHPVKEKENNNPEATTSENKIYLNLPHVGKTAFAKITAEISQNGAKFDGAAEAWYITDKADFNKFKAYLGLSREQVVNKRESVLNKLNENKAAIESHKEAGNEIGKGTIQRDELSK